MIRNSRLGHSEIMHHRLTPKGHKFFYQSTFWLLDLDELQELSGQNIGFGFNRFRPLSIYSKDYLGYENIPLKEKALNFLKSQGLDDNFQIRLFTCPQYFGYVFNPVSFYFCSRDEKLEVIIVEITNTFRERQIYLLKDLILEKDGFLSIHTKKVFHVSPFFERDLDYHFQFKLSDSESLIKIDLFKNGKAVFRSDVLTHFKNLTQWEIFKNYARHPLQAWLTLPRILLQAGLLYYMKKAPLVRKPNPADVLTIRTEPDGLLERFCFALLKKMLNSLSEGFIQLQLDDGRMFEFGDPQSKSRGMLKVHSFRFFVKCIFGADIGFGESFAAGDWSSPDLVLLLKTFILSHQTVDGRGFWSSLSQMIDRRLHLSRDNSLEGSRKNIQAHYDLGNRLFKHFLDERLVYSMGIFETSTSTLEDAQIAKLQKLLKKLELKKADHLLEIGSGWGAMAFLAAERIGCQVTTVTISQEQFDYVSDQIRKRGLQDRVTVLLQDYRLLTGKFDRIVSIEMIEAIGHDQLTVFFKKCDSLLKQDGHLVLQVISVYDQRYQRMRKEVDWIQKYIFPGSLCPSLNALTQAMTTSSAFIVDQLENYNQDYARTLAEWRKRFNQNSAALLSEGYDQVFQRTWNYYLAYCEAGFASGYLNSYQIVFKRPQGWTH